MVMAYDVVLESEEYDLSAILHGGRSLALMTRMLVPSVLIPAIHQYLGSC